MLEYWYSESIDTWLIADKATGKLVAKIPFKVEGCHIISLYFEKDVLEHNASQCEFASRYNREKKK